VRASGPARGGRPLWRLSIVPIDKAASASLLDAFLASGPPAASVDQDHGGIGPADPYGHPAPGGGSFWPRIGRRR
jgi:hypothetical protein